MSTRRTVTLIILLLSILLAPISAGIIGPGKYTGAVVFDRWGGCIFYRAIHVLYISEQVKAQLRPHAREVIEINATDVHQPMNPGDALIKQFTVIGPSPAGRNEWAKAEGLELSNLWVARGGELPRIRIQVINRSKQDREIFSQALAPTLLMRAPQARIGFEPFDGPAFALITRQAFEVLANTPCFEDKGIAGGHPYEWTIGKENALPHAFTLKPGESRSIEIRFMLPAGEYEFLSGYDGDQLIVGNQVPFDVNAAGAGAYVPNLVRAD